MFSQVESSVPLLLSRGHSYILQSLGGHGMEWEVQGAGGCLVLGHHPSSSTAQGDRQASPLPGCELSSLVFTVHSVFICAMVSELDCLGSSAPVLSLLHPRSPFLAMHPL